MQLKSPHHIIETLLVVCIFLFILPYAAGDYTLKVLRDPAGCYGGMPCLVQPQLGVYTSDGEYALSFTGYAYPQMGTSPSGSESLYIGTCDYKDDCASAKVVNGPNAAAYFEYGVAEFKDLMIMSAGVDYKIQFNAKLDGLDLTSSVTSDSFDVLVGDPYKLEFFTEIGVATGGVSFQPNPVVSIVDRGGNTVTSISSGYVRASLVASPEQLLPAANREAAFVGGYATFDNLHINEAGSTYTISFNTTYSADIPTLESTSFAVAIGSPSSLAFDEDFLISSATVVAGEFLKVTPRVRILDKGLNLVSTDSESAVKVSISGNPSGSTLTPIASTFAVASKGLVSFSTLSLDKVGVGYTLQFSYYNFSSSSGRFTEIESIVKKSESFNVVYGVPRRLLVSQAAAGAVGGGEPFFTQPVVHVVDYGGNVLAQDFSTVVSARLVSSLSASEVIRIDTYTTIQTRVSDVALGTADGSFGVGEEISVYVYFEYEVTLLGGGADTYVALNVAGSGARVAKLYSPQILRRTKVLRFLYVVATGDAVSELDYTSTSSLFLNGSSLYDGNNVTVDTTLPIYGLKRNHTVVIDTSSPYIVAIGLDKANGEYGVGEDIVFNVTYSQPVYVLGHPFLRLNMTTSGGYYLNNSVSEDVGIANYTSTAAGGYCVLFTYTVKEGQYSTDLSIGSSKIELNTDKTVNGTDSKIYRLSTSPSTAASVTISKSLIEKLRFENRIVVDSSRPSLSLDYGVRTSKANGTYYVGEEMSLSVRFTKPVSVSGTSIQLQLETKSALNSLPGTALFSSMGNDSLTMYFSYVVGAETNTSRLDVIGPSALSITGEGYIRRAATRPSLDANLSTSAIFSSTDNSLRSTAKVALNGFSPSVTAVRVTRVTGSDRNLFPDDQVYINVTFSAPVVAQCSPVFMVDAGFSHEATYVRGSGTRDFLFLYTVQVGDDADYIAYSTPAALCLTTGCPSDSTSSCYLRAMSTNPTASVTRTLQLGTGSAKVLIGNYTVSPASQTRNTTIQNITASLPSGEYGAGTTVMFYVSFTDDVLVETTIPPATFTYPLLYLNIGQYASYSGGIGSSTLIFSYTTTSNDSTTNLRSAWVPGTKSPLYCYYNQSCALQNLAGISVPLNCSVGALQNTFINLNAEPPRIVAVWSNKSTSPYDGYYSAGEDIYINVRYDKPVQITGSNPRLILDVGRSAAAEAAYALYSVDDSTSTILVFLYTVEEGDYTDELSVVGPDVDLYFGLCNIFRVATVPTTKAEFSLADAIASTDGKLSVGDNSIAIETREAPAIHAVRAVSPAGSYAAGDRIVLRIDLTGYVVLNSHAYIHLNAGDHIAKATYLGYNTSSTDVNFTASVVLPTPPTKTLFFKYEVGTNDFSPLLDIVDSFAFFVGLTPEGGVGTMLQASTAPTIPASIELPRAGTNQSISNSTALVVNGRSAYLTHVSFASPKGTYGVGREIFIVANFSRAVYVSGKPFFILETGDVDRRAEYITGSGSSELLFRYVTQPGDTSSALDYHVDRASLSSARSSFQLNGGGLYVYSSNPTLSVEVNLNPVLGVLGGLTEATASYGVSSFLGLNIGRRGPDYKLLYEASPQSAGTTLSTSQDLYVSFSSEHFLLPTEALKGDLVGYDVTIDDDIAVIGAPNSNLSVNSIQTISTTGAQYAAEREVQIIRTYVEPQPAVQTFHTTADIGEVVGGTFKLSYGGHGQSRDIPSNADAPMFKAIIEYDLPALGAVSVERRPYIYCACEGAFMWEVTFSDLSLGTIDAVTLDGSGLTGAGAATRGPSVIQAPALLQGSFRLSYEGATATSSALSYDASATDIANAIRELNIGVAEVDVSSTDNARCRAWTVTFDAYFGSYNVPTLISDVSGLSGGAAEVWHSVLRPGVHAPGGLGGYFSIEWRGNTTRSIAYNASASEVRLALEDLPVINAVSVTRSEASFINEYTWTVEFLSVNANSPRGYYEDVVSNLEPCIAHSNIIGTDADVRIGSVWVLGATYSELTNVVRQGSFGSGAGTAYVYQKVGEVWREVSRLVGNTSDEGDRFGSSVDTHAGVAIVGAVSADYKGELEVQSIYCSADTGAFSLLLRGWTSPLIAANSSATHLLSLLQSDSTSLRGLHGVTSVSVSFSQPYSGLCSNNTAFITFNTPVDTYSGSSSSSSEYEGSNLDLLAVTESSLGWKGRNASEGVVVNIAKVQAGTNIWHGEGSNAQQVGSAYIFRLADECATNASECIYADWTQEAQLYPPSKTASGSRFGHSVSVYANTASVGAPGSSNGRGAVFVYTYSNGSWSLAQEIVVMELVSGDNFGHAIDMHENTMVVSAPYSATGAYVYKRASEDDLFVATQILLPTKVTYPVSATEMFGGGVAVYGDTIALGSSGRSDVSLYLGSDEIYAENAGAVFVFTRSGGEYDFTFLQRVKASNVRRNDRFGHDVALHANRLVVSSIESFDGALPAAKAIILVRTVADYNMEKVGSTFRLSWEASLSGSETSSRAIPYDCSAALMKVILEEDLSTGALLVSRTAEDVYDGGYEWSVTFLASTMGAVPLFTADTSLLTGTNARVDISYSNESPAAIRGKAHIFQRASSSSTELFVEQAFLSPSNFQPVDRCGFAVSITEGDAIVGCPNRDASIPDRNSGNAIVFSLDTLDMRFGASKYTTDEGKLVTVEMALANVDSDSDKDIFFYLQTIDRNCDDSTGIFISHLYGISPGELSYPQTVLDFAGIAGTAIARAQYYGSTHNESVWVDGMFDYRGISDYLPIYDALVFLSGNGSSSIEYELQTTSDTILEAPEESIVIGLSSPGLWPSPLGNLYATVAVEEDGDGTASNNTLYDKLYASPAAAGVQLGYSVAVEGTLGLMFAGAPHAQSGSATKAGSVVFYRYISSVHMWAQRSVMYSPSPAANNFYGDEVVVKTIRNGTVLLAVGEPGANKVYVYSSASSPTSALGATFSLETTLSVDDAYLSQHRFGARGTIAIDGFIMAVGAPGLETVYVFVRFFDKAYQAWGWTSGTAIRSTNYDYDVIKGVVNLHAQDFGKSVALSGRTLLVGAPYADYGKLGSDLVEVDWKTDGSDIRGYGRGRAYVFYSRPAIVEITLEALKPLSAGTFKLVYSHTGVNATTTGLSAESSGEELKAALEELANMHDISVSSSSGSVSGVGFQYRWTVTFLSEFKDFGDLVPVWFNYSCSSCTPFDSLSLTPATQVVVATTQEIGSVIQHATLEASDKHTGNKFGWSVAVEEDQIAVGAIHSASMTSTTWDFEAGTLRGWSSTGSAFAYQPTYGDNSYSRAVDPGADMVLRLNPQSSRTRPAGLYYIGTYEKRSGSATNYLLPDEDHPAGGSQGDEPVGTLTSEVFLISGSTITFLVGGGCDYYTEYVELLIDGMSVQKHTGSCQERMDRVSFDVSLYRGQAAQIRIVDAATGAWGHINVDDFRFDWEVKGRVVTGANSQSSAGGVAESPRSGAVYMYRRHMADSYNMCSGDYFDCIWSEETRLTASDKRAGTFFGSSLALNEEAGVLVVGSPSTPYSGFYKETPSAYPYTGADGASNAAAGIGFPATSDNMPFFQNQPLLASTSSGAGGVWQLRSDESVTGDKLAYEAGGAVYVFTKEKNVVSSTGDIETVQHWIPCERAKLQPPDGSARDYFGSAVDISGDSLVVGATGNDGQAVDGGAIYYFDSKFAALSFSEVEYPVLEGTDSVATVTLLRDSSIYQGDIYIDYATSDLTAKGVDSDKYADCLGLAASERGPMGCGDYQQTSGTLLIPSGQSSAGFQINIINDNCYERFMKFVQITISVPGAAGLQGGGMSARVRIDDDDYLQEKCANLP